MTAAGERPTTQNDSPTPEDVLNNALHMFATKGFSDAKLEAIAKASGMSKRMIHYHFGDKKGLYRRCLEVAVQRLRPAPEEMQLESPVPVEGVQKVVEAVFRTYVANPDAVRLLQMENLHYPGKIADATPLSDQSAITLQLDKLLMLGQDSGAFRPGISAQDVFTIIAALAVFRINSRSTTINLYDIDMMDEDNTQGMARLATDTVLAFLTSNLQTAPTTSYLTGPGQREEDEASKGGDYEVSSNPFS